MLNNISKFISSTILLLLIYFNFRENLYIKILCVIIFIISVIFFLKKSFVIKIIYRALLANAINSIL